LIFFEKEKPMRYVKNVLYLLAVALFSDCNAIINEFSITHPDFSKVAGRIVAIDGNTLAFSYDRDVVVFKHQNGRWQYHSTISPLPEVKSYFFGELVSIAVKGDIIAVGLQKALDGVKGVVGIFQRNLNDDDWDIIKVLYDPHGPEHFDDHSLFGSGVVITDDYMVATPVGNKRKLNNGVYLYDCRSKIGKVLYADGGENKLPHWKYLTDIPIYKYSRHILSGNGKILLTVPYLNQNDVSTNTDVVGRIVVFEKKGGEWKIIDTIVATRADIPPGSERLYLDDPVGFSGEAIVARINSRVLADGKRYYNYEAGLIYLNVARMDYGDRAQK
jgi:hypothetical protein